jgi:hypothetical protein
MDSQRRREPLNSASRFSLAVVPIQPIRRFLLLLLLLLLLHGFQRANNNDVSIAPLDLISYTNFQRPTFELTAEVWATPKTTSGCTYQPATDTNYVKVTYTDLELCYTQNLTCSFYLGDNSDGWFYLNAAKQFGFQIAPSWFLTGTRVSGVVPSSQYVTVPLVTPEAKFGPITSTAIPGYQVGTLNVMSGGALRFLVAGGLLQRKLVAYSLTLQVRQKHSLFMYACRSNDGAVIRMARASCSIS